MNISITKTACPKEKPEASTLGPYCTYSLDLCVFSLLPPFSLLLSLPFPYSSLLFPFSSTTLFLDKKGFAGNRTRATRTQSGYFTT